jgi:hypothetical protein
MPTVTTMEKVRLRCLKYDFQKSFESRNTRYRNSDWTRGMRIHVGPDFGLQMLDGPVPTLAKLKVSGNDTSKAAERGWSPRQICGSTLLLKS